MLKPKSILIVGTGSWGQALAKICWKNCHDSVAILGRKPQNETLYKLQSQSPVWPNAIRIHDNLDQALQNNPSVIIATPSEQCAQILEQLGKRAFSAPVLCASKGMAHVKPTQFFHQYYQEVNPHYSDRFAYLAGPNFAHEIQKEQPAVTQIACQNQSLFAYWERALSRPNFYIRYHDDLIGTAWCGVFKNITAFLAGALSGCGYGANTRALLIQNACEQLQQLIISSGGNPQTAFSVAGMGDIVLSGTSTFSRNFQAGENPEINKKNLAESLSNIPLAYQWLEKHPHSHSSLIYLAYDLLQEPQKSQEHIKKWLASQSTL